MEYRERPERVPGADAGTTERPPASGLPGWGRAAGGEQRKLPARGNTPRSPQHPGGSRRREWCGDDSQPAESILRTTEHSKTVKRGPGATDSDDGGIIKRKSRHILDNLSSGVILLDQNLLIVGLNPAAENILGISERRAIGQSLLRLVDDEPELQEILARVIATGDHYANEMQLGVTEVHAYERIVDCRVSPLSTEETALLVEMTDVTRRSKITRENALLIQHGAGRQMIRQLAHEIKNPLGGIRGAAQLLERQLNSDELREYTDVVISETDRLAALVDTLLGPGGPPNKEPVNIHELLEYVVRIVEAQDQKQLKIIRDYDPGLPLTDLDRDQMIQALLNLVTNAVAALDGQGSITLRTRAEINFTIGNTLHRVIASIEIEDDGPGIPRELQDSVFYPLITSRPEGTGLGLPAAQELLSRHGGLIEFESKPGRTVFFVRIPLTPAETQ